MPLVVELILRNGTNMNAEPVAVSGDRMVRPKRKLPIAVAAPLAVVMVVGKGLWVGVAAVVGFLWAALTLFSPAMIAASLKRGDSSDWSFRETATSLAILSATTAAIHTLCQKVEVLGNDTPRWDDGSIFTLWNAGCLAVFVWTAGPSISVWLFGILKSLAKTFYSKVAEQTRKLRGE